MRRLFQQVIIVLLVLIAISRPAFATYSLPYPSYMPGNKLYTISRFFDRVRGWWSWGSIATFKYNLSLADKYLVEAKTLFEYKQYLLAVDALRRSDEKVRLLPVSLQAAKNGGKNIELLQSIMNEAMDAHIGVLTDLKVRMPSKFLWQPEKSAPTSLPLGQLLEASKEERISVQEFHAQ